MKGFKDFVMRGNLVELAVAFIIATAFAAVVKTFTDMLMALIGKIFTTPNFDTYRPGGVPVGPFLTALVAFLILAFIVYFFVVKPYEMAKSRYATKEEDAAPDEDIVLLREIRDALTRRA
ncbi:large conductance mechanosensitive channel protein MscL [Knoellia koreensis]|uniref:Large conductance mechanosensitive channel protein MscL n=1 Tax=Knoellia koreensis TaxID=2730921 RepID=A0A849HQ73_9MICO|nr:large conductance mechanosensitive channel protein MscL [Knoellia sp. DB2414S]NNM46747.1 large conductance mechanosensitive channel protein MscL [Knoellia sp. DB2414S]